MPIFGAAYAAPNIGTTILYRLSFLSTVLRSKKIVEFKDFSRLLSDFPVLFKEGLIFKDFSRKTSKIKYFSSLWEPCDIPAETVVVAVVLVGQELCRELPSLLACWPSVEQVGDSAAMTVVTLLSVLGLPVGSVEVVSSSVSP